jgi:aryl-alcohol dehydrogenase-like predicted oxidoreductase
LENFPGPHLVLRRHGKLSRNADPITDGKYTAAVAKAFESGINVLDSAINYRYQRSERNLGAGLKKAVDSGAVARDQVLICTKGGFVAGDLGRRRANGSSRPSSSRAS